MMINTNIFKDKGIIGYTSGVYDLLHYGHINFLQKCKANCDFLVVGVDEDFIVKKNKGANRPIQTFDIRMQSLKDQNIADFLLRKSSSFEDIIKNFIPHKYFIPDNRSLKTSRLSLIYRLNIELIIIPHTTGISTSLIFKNINA